MGWINSTNNSEYCEGDQPYGNYWIEVPTRPDPRYLWNGSAWALDATLATAASEVARANTERAAVATTPALKSLILMTPAQIDAWALANVTDLPSARNALVILAKIVAVLARNMVQ